jgi:hypothetical protein
MLHINKTKYFSFTAKKSLLVSRRSATFDLRKDCSEMLQEGTSAEVGIL